MYAIGFYGHSNSGKTTLIRKILMELGRDYRIACVKHAPHARFDTPGADSALFAGSGATAVAVGTDDGTCFMTGEHMALGRIIGALEKSNEFDLCLIEGYKTEGHPKVAMGRDAPKEANIVMRFDGDASKVVEFVRKNAEACGVLKKLPKTDCGGCGYDCKTMAMRIASGESEFSDCVNLGCENLEMAVNGKKIELGKFPSELVSSVVLGMAGSLKGVDEVSELVIRYKSRSDP
ncbi:MAG: molybdopterin-guanine dinucleotide biosynthesis protein B [Thermoplasmata archaeon HGW-Thermoplasmata-1]|nr:MAG: molybdopterin-guanine dinucleotide biosynthesis protein B [Thermoplasmata archaeon HGW-Thermoplasmata-1]